ncbi:PAS domain S-box-containing protein [Marmoricola sp. OAE513]|uniref:ATP-binding protein n=1 Tax=Marmoricola sp. OAE513 TaxID=2817894 RepID=UPI001AE4BA93
MPKSLGLRVGVVLALAFALGIGSVLAAPPGGHIGFMWPVGLASGAVAIVPRRHTALVVTLVVALVTTTYAVGEQYSLQIALGYGIGVGLEALVAQHILTAGWSRTWQMRDLNDLGRFVGVCVGSAFAGALVFTLVSWVYDFGVPLHVGIAAFGAHLVGQASLLGLFREHVGPEESYGSAERSITWGLTLLVTTIAFIPNDVPSLAFLVLPLLGWMAFRGSTREVMLQLVVVGAIASTLSGQGLGPFSNTLWTNADSEFQDIPSVLFLLACAMVSIPFSMAVTMQRRSAVQLVQEQARSERLVQSARGIAIIGTDSLGRINLFSPGAESILGYTPDEVYGQSTRMFHTEAEIARQAAELGTDPTYVSVVRATGELPPGTARIWQFVRKDGIPRTLSTIFSPIIDDSGDFVGYVATADDITDRIDAEAVLEKALHTERRAVKRLTEIDQVKDQFVSSVSHELRTPITNIVGYLELLMDGVYGEPNARQNDAMSRIDMNSRRLLTLIDDLLTLSSMESIDHRRRRSQVDLVTVVTRADEIVRPSLLQRDLEMVLDVPDEPVPLIGDAGELERLVINFATNAVKFTPDGGRIVVRLIAATDSEGPVLEVEDSGVGIREEDRAKLFTRFFRTTRAHELGVPGSGLGLSIAKAIADVHGGRISATSVYGKGSTFRVEFPLGADQVTDD